MIDLGLVTGRWNVIQSTDINYFNTENVRTGVNIRIKRKTIKIIKDGKREKADKYRIVKDRDGMNIFTKKCLFISLPIKLFITGYQDDWIILIKKNLITKKMAINVLSKEGELNSQQLLIIRKIVNSCEGGEGYLKYLKNIRR